MKSTHDRKYLIDLTLEQQRCRISCVLKSIKLLSKIEDISEITNRTLQADNRGVVEISKSLVHDDFPVQ